MISPTTEISQAVSVKQSTPTVIHLLILPKPLVFLLGSIMPLFAQNLSTPLLMTFPRFLTLSSSTEDVSIFSKPFAEIPLKLFTLYTIKHRKQSIKKQSTPLAYANGVPSRNKLVETPRRTSKGTTRTKNKSWHSSHQKQNTQPNFFRKLGGCFTDDLPKKLCGTPALVSEI